MVNSMNSKLVGVTMGDEGRQANVKSLTKGQEIFILRESNNPFDPNAMKLFADPQLTKPLGYIKKELARDLAEQRAKGWSYKFFCEEVTGKETQSFGCNIRIEATNENPN